MPTRTREDVPFVVQDYFHTGMISNWLCSPIPWLVKVVQWIPGPWLVRRRVCVLASFWHLSPFLAVMSVQGSVALASSDMTTQHCSASGRVLPLLGLFTVVSVEVIITSTVGRMGKNWRLLGEPKLTCVLVTGSCQMHCTPLTAAGKGELSLALVLLRLKVIWYLGQISYETLANLPNWAERGSEARGAIKELRRKERKFPN